MRIVIDLQGAQTESRFRGIGRYALSLAKAIVRNRGEHKIILALNGLFPDTIEPIRAVFDGLLPQENIRVWHAPGPVRECEPGNKWRREVAERIREAFLASLRPDVVHVPSLFEGYVDDAVTSIGVFVAQIPTVVTIHDLIPLLNPEMYLNPDPAYAHHYKRKIEYLKRANQWLAVSESAACEGHDILALPAESVIITYEGCDSVFRRMEIAETGKQNYLERFGITSSFILYSGGADARKNLHRLIRAYARLPKPLRDTHQLMMAGKIPDSEVTKLRRTAKSAGIGASHMLFTGYVTDEELARLYNLCTVSVLPSCHEGFGLPALEAMSCGAAVIGANTTSVPEVIGRQDALFDPYDEASVSQKLAQVLGDEAFRIDLASHGLERAKKFSWDESAKRAVAAFERLHAKRESPNPSAQAVIHRPKLAFVSPLPPERTGIADYSAELLPELAKHYDIEVVVAQEHISNAWVRSNCPVRNSKWLRANASRMDRVLYQFGNSPFHEHMLSLVGEVPGTIVMHDFFLSSLLAYLEEHNIVQHAWVRALHHAHGYPAVRERYEAGNAAEAKVKYPVNLEVLQHAQGVIVHSEYSRKLASEWFGEDFAKDWRVIPSLRKPYERLDRARCRAKLGLRLDDFMVCSFGFLDPTKLNHRLLEAWMRSRLAQDAHNVLVFVGENHGGEYGNQLLESIRASGMEKRIRITGWTDMPTFRSYLAATDIAVQLRTLSRGETSAAVLDCMNYALPTIVNANGSITDLSPDAVWMLPDAFENGQLVEALETLWQNDERRAAMGKRAHEVILTRHAPRACAEQYAEAIEHFHGRSRSDAHSLVKAIVDIDVHSPTDAECRAVAQAVAQSLPFKQPVRQLLLDISVTCRTDLKTGIERVARALVMAMLEAPPAGYRVEPVYLTNEGGAWHYRYARRYTLGLLECPPDAMVDEVVEPHNGDVLLGLDLSGQMLIDADSSGLFTHYRNAGVGVYFIICDLLPVQFPQFFPPGTDASHAKWLQVISKFDGAICISRAVADELSAWLRTNGPQRERAFRVGWFHLGADVESSAPTRGLPNDSVQTLSRLRARPGFLMVGTIEPRKGYLQTLDAFTQLWQEGLDINLVIVGREGWKGLPDDMRRTIPETVNRLRQHPELGKRLFWLEGISDEYLAKVYAASTCLIAASEGEGFGLPLIEAAQHKLLIIARDIPVFREVAGDVASYFKGSEPSDLAAAVKEWLITFRDKLDLSLHGFKSKTWKDSAESLMAAVNWLQRLPSSIRRKVIDEHLNLVHSRRKNMVSHLLPPGDIILDLGGANCPLYKMGYPHRFKKLYLIDLPPEARHDMYKEIVIDPNCDGGEVVIKYGDMTKLDDFADESVDFIWSGQSIEHVSPEAGKRMCQAVLRVLKEGGAFCIDTPNRRLTQIHLRGTGLEFIHPEHRIEYDPKELKQLLLEAGFEIKYECGICDMPNTIATGEFFYEDFIYGSQVSDDVTDGYIQFYHCIKP
jgi:glycosyltransferase involved in cell wall biosynthesis/predicted SAM-dependent methyltransferase